MSPKSTHACPGGCGAQVPRARLACKSCWYRLPAAYRAEIRAAYGRDARAHRDAVTAALAWYREHES